MIVLAEVSEGAVDSSVEAEETELALAAFVVLRACVSFFSFVVVGLTELFLTTLPDLVTGSEDGDRVLVLRVRRDVCGSC